MTTVEFGPRPEALSARNPPESRGLQRDEVRLLVTRPDSDAHRTFLDLPSELRCGDLLVVNRSATVPASLPAVGGFGRFLLNLSTDFGDGLWAAEPRWNRSRPGPVPLSSGATFRVAGRRATAIAPYPGVPRLWFVRLEGATLGWVRAVGRPIQYGYLDRSYPLSYFQSVFGTVPGSAEMPSAARPFSPRVLEALTAKGVEFAEILLHAGVSSLEVGPDLPVTGPLLPEPYYVPLETVRAIDSARRRGARVIAVGTTVIRALESAARDGGLRASRGFTLARLGLDRPVTQVDGLISGFHDPRTSHLELLAGLAGLELTRRAYRTALASGYLWHEFGDSHLIWGR